MSHVELFGEPSILDPSDLADRIAIMRIQEEQGAYRCQDYFSWKDVNVKPPADEAMPHHGAVSAAGGGGGALEQYSAHAASAAEAAAGGPQQQQQAQQQPQSSQTKPPVDAECRTKMVEWCTQVIDFCKFNRETVGISMSYLDRYVASGATRCARQALLDRKEYQLASMTCLYMAIKLNEPLEMETKLLSDLSRGCYDEAEIAAMEREILQALEWRLAAPTPLQFVQHFLAVGLHGTKASSNPVMGKIEATLLDLSNFQTELAMGIPALVSVSPSRVALSAVLNSMEAIDSDIFDPIERGAFLESILSASRLDAESVEILQVRTVLMDSFFRNSGYDLRHVASKIRSSLGGGRRLTSSSTEDRKCSPSGISGSSPVCVMGKCQ